MAAEAGGGGAAGGAAGAVAGACRILVVGSTMMDLVAYTRRVPGPGETIVGESFQMGFGGKGANQAVMAALLGARVSIANSVGEDSYGQMTLDNLASFGIDVGHVHAVSGASGVAPIWVEPDGTNRIIIVPGANHGMTADQAVAAVRSQDDLSVVVGQLEIPQPVTAAAFRAAREEGATTVLNPAPAAALEPDLLSASDWLIPNEVEFGLLGGGDHACDSDLLAFADLTGCRLLVTLGEQGTALVGPDGSVSRFAADEVDPVDTTGAGDAFVGAFAVGMAADLGEAASIRLGTVCAGASVTRPGTQTSFPSSERCREILADI